MANRCSGFNAGEIRYILTTCRPCSGRKTFLLARISFGEGWCLMPESFRIIKRNGIKFVELDNENVRLSLGLVCEDENLLKRMATALQQA